MDKETQPSYEGQFKGLRGRPRLEILQWHRLLTFEEAFDDFRQGKVSAAYVKERWNKLKECGLPKLR